jgi:hypothetical protein
LNEKNKTVAELWDGQNLKCTSRRNVSEGLYQIWLQVVELVSMVSLNKEEDEMVSLFSTYGIYSSQYL